MPATVSLRELVGDENVLLLAPRPGDETRLCGGLIAEACARGRPPYVAILTDGSSGALGAAGAERAARRATQLLGLPPGRLLMVGLHDGTVPSDGVAFRALVKGLALVMWARDCNVICVPCPDHEPDRMVAATLAEALADDIGIPLFYAGEGETALDIKIHEPTLHAARSAYGDEAPVDEKFLLLFSKRSASFRDWPPPPN